MVPAARRGENIRQSAVRGRPAYSSRPVSGPLIEKAEISPRSMLYTQHEVCQSREAGAEKSSSLCFC
jgi:hypothetical protein